MRKKYFTMIMLFLLPAFLFGCASQEANELTVDRKDAVIIALPSTAEPEAGFDPVYGWGAGEHVHEPLLQSTLTVTNEDLTIGYDLATDMEVSANGLSWRVDIRNDVYFTNGDRLTAKDVAFTYNTVKKLSTVNDFTMLDYTEAINDTQVIFHLNKPYAIWPYSMANVGIVPEKNYNSGYGLNPVGSGRYRLVQWDKGQQVILEANENYYGEIPKMKRVIIVFMNEAAAYTAVKANQVDLAYTVASYADNGAQGYHLLRAATVDNRGLNLPAIPFDGTKGNDVTSDLALRQAINIGIDRQALIENVLYGYGQAAYSVCDAMPWFNEASVVAYDLAAANALLDDAGWQKGADGIRQKEAVLAQLNIIYPADDSLRQAIAAEVANQLQNLGIKATYEGVGWDSAYERAQRDVLVWGWGAHTPMEMYNIYHRAPQDDLAIYSPYANETADQLMDQALTADSLEHSFVLWQEAQALVNEDIPWVWLANVEHLYWCRDGLQIPSQKIHPHGHGWSIVNNVDKWSWSE